MKQIGTVIETKNRIALVEVTRMSACEGCHKNAEGCAVCAVVGGKKAHRLYAKNEVDAKAGDRVELSASSGKMLFYAFSVFVLPVISAIAFYFLSSLVFDGAYPFLFALLGVLAVFAVFAATQWMVPLTFLPSKPLPLFVSGS